VPVRLPRHRQLWLMPFVHAVWQVLSTVEQVIAIGLVGQAGTPPSVLAAHVSHAKRPFVSQKQAISLVPPAHGAAQVALPVQDAPATQLTPPPPAPPCEPPAPVLPEAPPAAVVPPAPLDPPVPPLPPLVSPQPIAPTSSAAHTQAARELARLVRLGKPRSPSCCKRFIAGPNSANLVPAEPRREVRSGEKGCPYRFTDCPCADSAGTSAPHPPHSSAVDATRLKVLTQAPDDSDCLGSLVVLGEPSGTHRWTSEFNVGWNQAGGGLLDTGTGVALEGISR
jgi:hypothetical protein